MTIRSNMRKPPAAPPKKSDDSKALRMLRGTLLLLIFELTFEGLARKMNIAGTNIAIFVLKDVIVAALGIQILRLRRPPAIQFLWAAYMTEIFLFRPLIIQTAIHDPILAIFGAKEYLLYPLVAFAVFLGFEKSSARDIVHFFRWIALLVIPTAAVALIQLRLPPTHWLNMSVDGQSLEGFSAAGFLRVSSTFPFVAQYCAFINAEVFIAMLALNNLRDVGFLKKMLYLSIVPLLVVSSYVTGSRGAVLIDLAIMAIAGILSLMKFQVRSALRVGVIIGGLFLTLAAAHYLLPDAFAAYSEREQGQLIGASTEIQQRIYDATFGWIAGIVNTPFLGYGLGIMSNGSQLISNYALTTRAFTWTETDFATTLFEGGFYLVLVWYAFRYYVIYQVVKRFLGMISGELSIPCAFCAGYVTIIGLTETLALQPPIAIWFWLAVGTALLIWWKSVEPKQPASAPAQKLKPGEKPKPAARQEPEAAAVPASSPTKVRGQSAYAQRLHAGKK